MNIDKTVLSESLSCALPMFAWSGCRTSRANKRFMKELSHICSCQIALVLSLNIIFEGDIVQTKHGRLCKIVWRSNSAVNCWDIVPLECKHRSPDERDLWDSKNLLVVGNIHDTPELLKGKNDVSQED